MTTLLERRRPAAPHWVGDGFPVRTYFAYDEPAPWSPFLMLDYAAPSTFAPASTRRGVGPHPHRGFETVTIAYAGTIEHRDSAGGGGRIGPGDVQWMTAGSGLVHEEMHGADFTRAGCELEMVQLWVNLPRRVKRTPPRYQDLLAANIPAVALPDAAGTARVIAGDLLGACGPAATHTRIVLADLQLRDGRAVELPLVRGDTALLLVQRGRVQAADGELATGELGRFARDGDRLRLVAAGGNARALLLAGAPIDEPVVGYGPFVMNTRAEIAEAVDDFHAGRMGTLPE